MSDFALVSHVRQSQLTDQPTSNPVNVKFNFDKPEPRREELGWHKDFRSGSNRLL